MRELRLSRRVSGSGVSRQPPCPERFHCVLAGASFACGKVCLWPGSARPLPPNLGAGMGRREFPARRAGPQGAEFAPAPSRPRAHRWGFRLGRGTWGSPGRGWGSLRSDEPSACVLPRCPRRARDAWGSISGPRGRRRGARGPGAPRESRGLSRGEEKARRSL